MSITRIIEDKWQAVLLCSSIFLFLAVWALAKAPFQTPDEFAHFQKTLSVRYDPWLPHGSLLRIPAEIENPLLLDSKLHALPFYPKRKILKSDLKRLKSLQWPKNPSEQILLKESKASHYPPLFYLPVFALGQGSTWVFGLSPYSSHAAYRLSAALMAAFLWTLVWGLLRTTELKPNRTVIIISALLIPMLAFMSSAINPDAFFFPLSALACIASSEAFMHGRQKRIAFFSLLIACLVKQAGWVLCLAIGASGLLMLLIKLVKRQPAQKLLLAVITSSVAPIAVSWLVFYFWLPPGAAPDTSSQVVPLQLWSDISDRLWGFWVQGIGLLGWTDYKVRDRYYWIVLATWCLNSILFCLSMYRKFIPQQAVLLFSFFLFHTMALFALEFLMVKDNPTFILQGRYLLPTAIGAFIVVHHRWRWAQALFILSLIVINVVFVERSIGRYFGSGLQSFWYVLPGVEMP